MRKTTKWAALVLGVAALSSGAWAQQPPASPGGAALSQVATFEHVPVGVAASSDGRVFLAFSRAIDPKEPISVAELKDGKPVPFPRGFKQEDGAPAADRLLSVQSVYVDGKDRLWILDTGKVGTNPVKPGSPKLIGYDLKRERVVTTVRFPASVAGATSFLNDVRVDTRRGKGGVAYLTDASPEGPNGIVVVDLASGKAVRRLNDHPSTKPDKAAALKVEGQPLVQKSGPMAGQPFAVGADGIALSPDGKHLYYSPLTSRKLYRVDAAALADPSVKDAQLAARVEDLGDKPGASDGLLEDAQGRVYLTDFENGALLRRSPDGKLETVAKDPRLQWPDTLALKSDGTLLITVTQIHRSERFRGKDERQRPFVLLSLPTDSRPAHTASAEPKK